mmetsp:Transcript_2870/g.7977  ORF Transcript_2870/g.7977 Transcript_2870/m.7977 type:complete len:237 (-) Transcript_2870:156-866(-)
MAFSGHHLVSWGVLPYFAATIVGVGADSCTDMYKVVLKRPQGVKVTPAEVASLYFEYCKKNMKVSSAKSMDELCAPLVRKIEEKMRWVPPDVDVTPALACKNVEKIKEEFPEYIAVAEAQLKVVGEDEAKHKHLVEKAKDLKNKLGTELKAAVSSWGEQLVKDLGTHLQRKTEEVLGPEFGQAGKDALAKQMQEAASLSSRGVETKLLQKLEEAVGTWATLARKEARAKAAAKPEL